MPSQAMGGGNVQALMVPLSLIPKEQCSGGSCLSGQKEKKIYKGRIKNAGNYFWWNI